MGQHVGIRELQQHATRVVADAVANGPVTITQRGRPVAQLIGLAASGLDELRAQGAVTPSRRSVTDLPPAIVSEQYLSETLRRMRDGERE